jgi:alpha-tubulin suppressor-like RCC1 family protein
MRPAPAVAAPSPPSYCRRAAAAWAAAPVPRWRSWWLLVCLAAAVSACADRPAPVAPLDRPAAGPSLLVVSTTPNTFAQVSAGRLHTCALRGDGVAECWGSNGSGQAPATRTAASGIFTQVSAGRFHTCAVRGDGVAECWGFNASAQAPATRAAATGGFTQVSGGDDHTCAVRGDGVAECWGLNDAGQAPATRAAASGSFAQVSAGSGHTCALRDDGVVECWGNNTLGQAPATRPAATGGFAQVSAGSGHTCALRDDGVVECWGNNTLGQAPATRAAATGGFAQVSASDFHTCAVRSDGVAECWGNNTLGQAPATRAAATGGFTQVSVGDDHTCAVRSDGVAECWGSNVSGQAPATRAAGVTVTRVLPTATFSATPLTVYPGEAFTLALTGAQVPGHPQATAFTYAFDCGGGSYGTAASAASASCPASAAGALAVRGKVIDQDNDAAEYAATVTVRTPAAGLTALRAAVTEAALAPDLRRALTAKLDDALGALAKGKVNGACGALRDFLSLVRAQREKAIPAATADAWAAEATRLRAALGC